jgi:alpha-N-arabinofuranosidase
LGALGDQVDWLAVHMAYMPFAWNGVPSAAALYWAAMASAASVQADLSAFTADLAALRPGRPPLPMALTEYNALFTLGKGDTDNWVATPAGALYVADLLRSLAMSDLQMANQWSLSGNWRFGAIHSSGYARPGYQVLNLLSEAFRGEVWPLQVDTETVATTTVGLADARPALPLVEALLCADGSRLNLLLIHKDPVREASGRIDLAGLGKIVGASMSLLSAPDLLSTADTPGLMPRSEQTLALPPAGEPLTVRLPPGSVGLLRLDRPS